MFSKPQLYETIEFIRDGGIGRAGLLIFQYDVLGVPKDIRQMVHVGQYFVVGKHLLLGRSDATNQVHVPAIALDRLSVIYLFFNRHHLHCNSLEASWVNNRDGHPSNRFCCILWCYLYSFGYNLSSRYCSFSSSFIKIIIIFILIFFIVIYLVIYLLFIYLFQF